MVYPHEPPNQEEYDLLPPVRTQNWHKADQANATDQTGVPQRSDRWGVL
jgi:hypothetical protein